MLVMLTIITLLLAPSFSAATLCVQNDVAKFTIGLRDEIAESRYVQTCTLKKNHVHS